MFVASIHSESFLFFKFFTVPSDFVQDRSALVRSNHDSFTRSRQIETEIAVHIATLWIAPARKWKQPANNRLHLAVRSNCEELQLGQTWLIQFGFFALTKR